MSEIPSNIASSASQAGFQAREVNKERQARQASKTNAVNHQAKAIDEASLTVDTDETDSRVFSDAEGSGSQGRATEEVEPEEEVDASDGPVGGVSEDDEGHLHVDIEA